MRLALLQRKSEAFLSLVAELQWIDNKIGAAHNVLSHIPAACDLNCDFYRYVLHEIVWIILKHSANIRLHCT